MADRRLTTARLDLVPLTAADAEDLFPVFDDPAIGRWTGDTPPADADVLRRRFAVWEAGPPDAGHERWLNWTMRRRDDDRAVGHLQSTVAGDRAAVAWVVGAAFQGRGFATEAARALVDWLQDQGVTEIEASIHPGNVASQMVAQRAGLRPTDRLDDGEVVWVYEPDLHAS